MLGVISNMVMQHAPEEAYELDLHELWQAAVEKVENTKGFSATAK